ncbi:MAG: hypothetical protein D9V47_12370 [Clostridia bacterium]|nr:MAG: hypothetical protein D9V47_12370 [Clostridia bacterium]
MFLERLVALGKTFISCGMGPDEILRLISDVPREGRFLENVAVIEASLDGGFRAEKLPLQVWGVPEVTPPKGKSRKRITVFRPETDRGLGIPFVRPGTGNPTVAQGRYGLPVYPLFPGMLDGLAADLQAATSFWRGRLERTMNLPRQFTSDEIGRLAALLQTIAAEMRSRVEASASQGYGLLVLCFPSQAGPYRYASSKPVTGDRSMVLVGDSVLQPGSYIVADLARVAELFKVSKTEEGAEGGRTARCSLCGAGNGGEMLAVSAYTKAWPWLAPTWHPPFPEKFKQGKDVTNIADTVGALCPDCYTALVVGAGVFDEVSGELPQWLTRELFMPVLSAGGREGAKKLGGLPRIRGAVLVVPVQEITSDDAEALSDALTRFRLKQKPRPGRADRALQAVTGLEGSILPEELDTDACRLLMVYYTQANADIHLRATIDDVLPSTVGRLLSILGEVQTSAAGLRELLFRQSPEWLSNRYESLVYFITRAYGGPYLWQTLADILHRREINWERFAAGAAARMAGYARLGILAQDMGAYRSLKEEVLFYQAFRSLYTLYYREILGQEVKDLAGWKEMLDRIAAAQPEELAFADPEELGFAAGYLVARFGRQYYARLKKNFLQHRVMTFGSSMTPDDIWRRALSRFQEYALKLQFGLPEDFRRRAAVVECEYRRMRDAVARQKDEFMGAFWSGYMLAAPPEAGGEDDEVPEEAAEP